VLPGIVLTPLHRVAQSLLPGETAALAEPGSVWLTPLGAEHSSYSGLIVLLAIALLTALTAAIIHRFASNRSRRGAAWDCGFPNNDPATQYTASSFAQPIRRIFGSFVFGARDKVDMPSPGEIRAAHFETTIGDPVWRCLYLPIVRLVNFLADRLNVTQFLTIRRYLSLMFGALVLLLLIVAVSQ
jgi:hydrogenase-4 component B